ncbi:hypothetical protein ACJX0J_041499, partial [Zea mays]
AIPEGTSLPTVEETSLVDMTLEDWEDVASETEETKAGKIVRLELEINDSLLDSEEEDGVRIAPVMSSLFDDEDDEDSTVKIFATKVETPSVVNASRPDSLMVEPATLVATPLATVVAEENVGSSKPIMAEDKGKKPAELEDAKKAIEDDAPLGEGPFDQELGGRKSEVSRLRNKSDEKKSFKVLESDFLKSRTEVQTLTEEKNKLKEALERESSGFKASNVKKDKRTSSLEAELREAGDKFEDESRKLKLATTEAATTSQ